MNKSSVRELNPPPRFCGPRALRRLPSLTRPTGFEPIPAILEIAMLPLHQGRIVPKAGVEPAKPCF